MTYHKWSLVIMRAQPFHLWHSTLLERALQTTPRVLCVLGSMSEERTARNPFLVKERREMIRAVYPYAKRLVIAGAFDIPHSDVEWREQIATLVENVCQQEKCLIVANCKDGEDYLTRIFAGWDQSITYHNYYYSATQLRDRYFRGLSLTGFVPREVWTYLKKFRESSSYRNAKRIYLEEQGSGAA